MPRFGWFLGSEQFHPEEIVALARRVERAGFDAVVVSEHFHPWVDDAGTAAFALTTLGAVAVATERVELATAVVTPLFRFHPAVVAQAAATIDRLSGGRFRLGVGTGENLNEGPLGYAFPPYAERAARMAEALPLMRRLLDGETVDSSGRFYRTRRERLYSPPLGPVPIWLGTGGPRSATLAGSSADGVIVSVKDPAASRRRVVDPARRAATAGNRPLTVVATRWCVVARDEDEAWTALRPWRGLRAPGRLEAVDPAELRTRADALPRREVLSRYVRAVTSAELTEVYRPLVTELRADLVVVQAASSHPGDLIDRFGGEVLPRLRAVGDPSRGR